MDLRQVTYVVAVVDHGGFTRAAAAIPVSQPSLSQGIRALEAELGTELFHRLARGVQLTVAGEAFVASARQLLRDVRTARDAVAAVAGLRAGHLDLVALPTLAVEPLVAVLGAFHAAHPGVMVRVREPEDSEAAVALVRDGTCEVGLVELPGPDDLAATVLGDQEIVVVRPPSAPPSRRRITVAQLAELDLVTTPPGTSTRRLIDRAFAAAGVTPNVAVETAHREALLPLVLAGAGTSFLPEPMARLAAERGAVIARLAPTLSRTIGLVHRRGPLSPAAQAFHDLSVGTVGR